MQSDASSLSSGNRPRRNFLVEFGAVALGGLAMLAPLVSGLMVLLDPLRRKRTSAGSFVRITTVESVPDDGLPRSFAVVADRADAWSFHKNERLGAVYLRREPGTNTVQAFHATCPHAGCFVSFLAERKAFKCPCHNSAFAVDGVRLKEAGKENPAPRDLDTLEIDPDKLTLGEVWVKFENFRTGIHDKIATA